MKYLAALVAGFALSSAPLRAQSSSGVPESHRPPPGMCRIWIDGVPPTHQPAPTDCATAIRKRPLNARVVFGSDRPAGNAPSVTAAPRVQSSFATPNAPPREDQDRAAQQQRDAQERERIEAQRQREERQKRESGHPPPPPPPQSPHEQERAAPQPRARVEKSQRPPQESHSARRPR